MDSQASRQFSDSRNRFCAAFAHDIGCAELLGQRDPVRMAAQEDDSLCAESPCGDDAAKPHSTIADDGGGPAATHARRDRGVMAGAHHV